MQIEPKTLKGFRDFLPKVAKKRQYVLNVLVNVFESYGFKPLETPSLEYEEILTGKYGIEGEKLMYKFEDNGKRKVALRYDQTVPLARVIAQYQNEIKFPFKRYQIQNVWRAENTQKGRYREFLQVDADTVGSSSLLVDAEVIACALECIKKLGFKKITFFINDRSVFKDLKSEYITAIDKWEKIGEQGVLRELIKKGCDKDKAEKLLKSFADKKPNPNIETLFALLKEYKVEEGREIVFKARLARGLNYYTSTIFEAVSDDYPYGTIVAGGRYDNLIGMFTNKNIPAVGFAFGLDRLIGAMEELKLFPENLQVTKILVTLPSLDKVNRSLEIAQKLRDAKINTEIYLGDNLDLEKQLKYADNESIPYVIIFDNDKLILKDMQERAQEEITIEKIIKKAA